MTSIFTKPTNESIYVEWTVEDDCVLVKNFSVSWRSIYTDSKSETLSPTSRNTTIPDLSGCTKYKVVVTPNGEEVDYTNGSQSDSSTTLTEGS